MKPFVFRLLASTLCIGQIATSITAYATDLTDIPMAVKNNVKPNVMFTLDDSGSMQFQVLPESLITNSQYYTFPQNQGHYGSDYYACDWDGRVCVAGYETGNVYAIRHRSPRRNKIYYNPEVTYAPWSNSDGSLMGNASATCAYHNPRNTALGCRNLTVTNNGNAGTSTDSYAWWVRYDGTSYWWFSGNYVDGVSGATGFWPATYFAWNSANAGCDGNDDTAACYTRVEIRSTTATYTGGPSRTDCASAPTCTYAEEIQNFANWYQYYRSRILTARAGVGRAFARQQSGSMRVGFGAINKDSTSVDGVNTSTISLGVRSFSDSNRTAFFTNLYDHAIPAAGTPLRKALDDVGQYFKRTDDQGPWGENPGSTGGTQWSCRANYHILMTDGYWTEDSSSQASTADARANVDNTAGSAKTSSSGSTYTYAPGNPYSDSYSNTLADAAMYYWVNDLRTDLGNNVQTNSIDPAFWQHLTNYTVGLGVTGTISKANIDSCFTSTPATISWPDPTASDMNKVDDLAHAAVNSRGGFHSASDPTTFSNALGDALDDVIGRNGAAAAVAVSNANVTSGDNASYASTYNSGSWTGDLQSYTIDLTTGVPSSTPSWADSAQAQLDAKTASSRVIATYSGTDGTGQGRPFQAAGCSPSTNCISAAQQATLNTPYASPGTSDGAAVLAYLRGTRTGETAGTYRSRAHVLGDIIDAEPVIIREPANNYADTCYSSVVSGKCTTSFKAAQAARTKVIAQGANDGMLHFFLAADGAESWSYIPKLLFDQRDPSYASASTLNMISRRSGYNHKNFVDSTPVLGDVDFSNTDGVSGNPDPDWHTILVGGLGKGGRGYYALDVTSPTAATEAAAAGKVLWEFPNSSTDSTIKANIGYSFGRPIVVKTAEYGWVVLVSSGYNNGTGTDNSGGDGHGYLWVLNAKTGAVLQTVDTTVGSAADPSGLAQIAAYVDNTSIDNTTDYVYGGDLKGNVWRFDLTDSSGSIVYSVKRLAILKDASGNLQPITTTPELAKIAISGVDKRFVYVGTGRYLGDTDMATNGTQTMYGLVDDLSTPSGITPVIADATRSSLQQQTFPTTSSTSRTASTTPVDYATQKGWYIDLPGCAEGSCTKGSERINTDPVIALGALIFTSNIPNADQCLPGGSSWVNVLDYKTGGFLSGSTASWSSAFLGNALASRPVLIKLPSGAVKALVRTSDAQTVTTGVPLPTFGTAGKRVTWKEITE